MSVPVPVNARDQGDQLKREVMIMSSPMRLGSGGRARLAREPINHHEAIRGRIICRPRAKTMVRLWVRS